MERSTTNSLRQTPSPILAYRDHNKEFTLHVDASGTSLEAVLLQH